MRRMAKFLMLLCLFVVGRGTLAQSTGTVTYVYTDPQGTPLAEADASGNITATFDYTPYGTYAPNGTSNPGPDPNGPGYTGHVNDPETNLVYMQARYYDAATGHFLSTDLVNPDAGNTFNFNRYAYAYNNPVIRVDPDGRQTQDDESLYEQEDRLSDPAVAAGELQASEQLSPMAIGFVPIAGDVQNIYQAINDPSPLNVIVAVIGAVPEVGSGIATTIKEAKVVETAAADSGKVASRASKMQREVERGQAPRDVDRVDKGHGSPGAQDHVHFKDGTSMNKDGTVHDAHKGTPNPSNKVKHWLEQHGWISEPSKQ